MPEVTYAVSTLVFAIVALIHVFNLTRLAQYVQSHHAELSNDLASGISRWRALMSQIVFDHKRLRRIVARSGVSDATLDALITRAAFWYRLSVALFVVLVLFVIGVRMGNYDNA